MEQQHRQKISDALKRYHSQPGSHLHQLHKSGSDHPNFKGGIKPDYYRRIAFDQYGKSCNRCGKNSNEDGSPAYLVIHHIDENRRNSDLSNLEVLCMSCHLKHHRRPS
jgi:5-methylcytosine-specific restriction endonuclease McrA